MRNKIITPNKICVTEKGLNFLNQQKHQLNCQSKYSYESLSNLLRHRNPSLPLLNTYSQYKSPQTTNKLSQLSLKKFKLQKIGLKRIKQQKQQSIIREILQQQLSDEHDYFKSIINQLAKKSKQKNSDIQSRIERVRVYVNKVKHQYENRFVFKVKDKYKQEGKNNNRNSLYGNVQ